MKRWYSVLLLIVILFTLSQIGYASSYQYRWIENVTNYYQPTFTYYNYSLQKNVLQLPGENYKTFSSQAHKMLLDLAEMYGESELDLSLNEPMLRLLNRSNQGMGISEDNQAPAGTVEPIKLNPLPGMLLNADYNQDRDELKIETKTNIQLKYQVNSRTLFRAGYGLVNKEWWNVQEITLRDNNTEQNETGDTGSNTEPLPGTGTDTGDSVITDPPVNDGELGVLKQQEMIFNEETNQESSFGISYQTSDYVTISADYINDGFFNQGTNYSTIFGVEYTDKAGKLRAKYQVDQGETVSQRITGLEFDFNNLATVSASYKLLDPQLLTDQLKKETVWDFGLDLSLTDLSSLSIGYQMINNQETENEEENAETTTEDKETNIKASLKIKF